MSNWKIRQAVSALNQGKVIAYPTEAVYGLGCDPWHEHAVYSLLDLKDRPWQKGLILVAANVRQLDEFIAPLDTGMAQQVFASWPGPTTWILPARKGVPSYLRGEHDTIAVRVTAHPQTVELCRQFGGAIVSTSANITGMRPAKSSREVQWQLPEIETVLSGSCGGADKPTQIKDGQTGDILR
ncbi:MAG: Sua5/YciO/YrdC/YwlC family protein [Methylophaga sp.]|nr:Sua5/YciO/YrdC/YwlC family protein [Methylophaga sp.]